LIAYGIFLIAYWIWPKSSFKHPPQVEAYVQQFRATAIEVGWDSGVPPAIILAVGALESGWGRSDLAQEGKNHFGMKGKGTQGARYCSPTQEFINGRPKRVKACFRAYENAEESYRDFVDWLRNDQRYAGLFELSWKDYEGWAHGLQEAGYATDPAYAEKLIRMVEKYRLHKVDQ
jgi:flagellum-specific peptidoglycan hydrolase FlgJ